MLFEMALLCSGFFFTPRIFCEIFSLDAFE